MSRHAKNNTASAVFTYYERSRLKYGTQKQRLGKDSMKHFDSCSLCLQPVTDPMCCLEGHIYCKECIYENILSQKKEIKKSKKQFEEQQQELKDKEELKKQQQKEEEIAAFGKAELAILPETHHVFRPKGTEDENHPSTTSSSTDLVAYAGPAAKGNPLMVANAADPDKGEKLKLNAFWVPSLTPSAAPKLLERPKLEVMCIEGNHPIRLKKLVKVNFIPVSKVEKADPKQQNSRFCCPVCRRTLTDAYKSVVLKTCGHVMCQPCLEKFKNEKICTVCDTPFKSDSIIKLQSGGTGFSSHDDKIVAKKDAPAAWV